MRVLVVLGTRPEAVKLAPVIRQLRLSSSVQCLVCSTGQHRQMLDQVLTIFGLQPDYDLNIMRPGQTLTDITCATLSSLEGLLQRERPDIVVVQGDTTTAFAASLAAFYQRLPIAHVEAGLRTHCKYSPFPEEMNRALADRLADFLFAPTEQARENLLREGFAAERIFVTGNTVVDALQWMSQELRHYQPPQELAQLADGQCRLILVTGHRRESFGSGFEQICLALRQIARAFPDVRIVYPVHLNPHVREPVFRLLQGLERVHLIDPLPYPDFIWLMMRSYLILTDSGGVQEEAPALGKPVLVMRETTERPEGIQAGVARLVGVQSESIFAAARELLADQGAYAAMARATNPYGDGHAAERIVGVLLSSGL
jgi:UDP-N-acetylglucosamine 2-epimerase (non-hydrolysing)